MTAPVQDGSFGIEHIAELWPNVRADVKALNRRIEALLSEVDPVAISGNQITLAVPYPFHRDKLNSDDVRETVGGVLSRLLGKNVSLDASCAVKWPQAGPERSDQLRTQLRPHQTKLPASTRTNEPEIRLRAAMNIFDAEEIREPEPADGPVPASDA